MATEANSGAANLIPPVKGEVRNPKGRPKGIPNSKTRYKRFLELIETAKNPVSGQEENMTVLEIMDLQMIAKARKGDAKAYEIIMDRLEGKPAQPVDMTLGAAKTTEDKIKGFLDDTDDSAYEGGSESTPTPSAEGGSAVAIPPSDIS